MKKKKELTRFDWKHAETRHRPETIEFLKSVFNKPISEEEFVKRYKSLPGSKRQPSKATTLYSNLKARFGFF